jgi:hypothetical protein
VLGFSLNAAAEIAPPELDAEQLYRNVLSAITQGDAVLAQQGLQQLMESHPTHAGAWLDAAMLWCQLGQTDKAMETWAEIEKRFTPPPGILEFIAAQRQRGCTTPTAALPSIWRLELGRGHTSNANQGPRSLQVQLPSADGPVWVQLLPDAAPRSDHYTQLELGAEEIPLTDSWKLHAQWQWRRHDTVQAMDMHALAVGIGRRWQLQDWQGRLSSTAGLAWLDQKLYQRSAQLQTDATPPWQPGGPWRWQLSAALQQLQYPTLTNFDATRWELNNHLSRESAQSRWQATLGVLYDQGHAQRPGGNRRGWLAGAYWSATVGQWQQQPLIARLQWQWQNWSGAHAYAPGVVDAIRIQRTRTASAALLWQPDPHNAWILELRHVRNNENIGLFAYDMTQLQLNWRHQWVRSTQ